MPESFSYDLSVPGTPAEALARLKGTVTERLRVAGRMRLAGEDANSLTFRPRWSFPLLLAASRTIGGETVKLNFSAGDGGTGTRVAVAGKVGGSVRKLATREFWAETLQAS
ncbi:MAG TPA: hypothetical protein VMA77_08720 [Solirubrobacteraceae bacterium]|nr:hypothetical protein [Solirubrobacteraceae bacterium]